jgi:hypothetical protein
VIKELDDATTQLEDVRKHLQLSDESCELVLKPPIIKFMVIQCQRR